MKKINEWWQFLTHGSLYGFFILQVDASVASSVKSMTEVSFSSPIALEECVKSFCSSAKYLDADPLLLPLFVPLPAPNVLRGGDEPPGPNATCTLAASFKHQN